MRAYYLQNIQLYSIFLILLVIGAYTGPLIYVIFPLVILRFKQREMYLEMLIGFFLVLILSDSEELGLLWAKNLKTVYVVLLALFVLFDRKYFTPYNSLYKIFLPFFLISVYCIFYSETTLICIQKTLSYFLLFLVIPNFITKLYRDHGTDLFKSIIFFGATILMAGIVLIFVRHSIAYNVEINRFRGVFGNPNGLGLFCFLFFTLFYTLNNTFESLFTSQERILIYSLILLSIVLSSSRNAFVSVLILLVFTRFFKDSPFLGFILSLIMIFANFLLIDQLPLIIQKLGLQSFLRLNTLDKLSGRSVAWGFAWLHIQDNFFIGKGFGFDEFLMRQNSHMLGKLGHQGGVHSSLFSLWLNFGLIGLLVYMRSFFLTFIKASKINKLAFPIMYAVLFSAAFEGLFIGSLNPHMIILLMIITIVSDSDFAWNPDLKPVETPVTEEKYEVA